MTEIPWFVWAAAAAMFLGLLLLLAIAAALLVRWLSRPGGGWKALARQFPAPAEPAGEVHSAATIQIGRVVYKNCVRAVLASEGLYLDAGWLLRQFGQRPILIPWAAIGLPRPTTLHWQAAVELPIGAPPVATLVVKQPLYERLAPRLVPGAIEAELVGEAASGQR